MCGEVGVALLVSRVLWNEVEVLATDDDGTVHLGGDDGAGEDTTADGDEAGEGALLVWSITLSDLKSWPAQSSMPASAGLQPGTENAIPMYFPSIAVLGVLNPRPTSLYHLLPPLPTRLDLAAFEPRLWLAKMCGCFWKARSLWTVNSVAMNAVVEQSGLNWRGWSCWR
jgi:hypothetical protein